jgi:hypothetical protein
MSKKVIKGINPAFAKGAARSVKPVLDINVLAQEIIAGWDTWDSITAPTATVTASGITASATGSASTGNWSISDNTTDPGRGSSGDTTWGTFDGAGSAASDVTDIGMANLTVTNGRPSAEVTFTLSNGSGADVDVNSFHMDVVAFRPNAARTYTLRVLSGDPMNDNSTNAITHLGGQLGTGHDVHDDLDVDMMSLADHTLADGESVVIQIEFTNGTGSGGGHHLFLDNVAFSTVITEPVVVEPDVLLGDVDLNEMVDFADIPAFIAVLQGGTGQAEADCNEDGMVDFSDIPAFIAILQGG